MFKFAYVLEVLSFIVLNGMQPHRKRNKYIIYNYNRLNRRRNYERKNRAKQRVPLPPIPATLQQAIFCARSFELLFCGNAHRNFPLLYSLASNYEPISSTCKKCVWPCFVVCILFF